MKAFLLPVAISLLSVNVALAADSTDKDILASRGEGVVTQEDFSARADRIPAQIRRETLRNGNRLQDVLNTMLLQSQLAAAASDAGFDKEKVIQDRMRLAAETELGNAWLDHYVDTQPDADYMAMAKEYYQLNKDKMKSTPKIDVSHILISSKEHTRDEALEIANEIQQQLNEDPTQFDALVLEYSEDPSVASNQGQFKAIKKGDMVKPFEDAAFILEDGEISAPVETNFGFHIIRLDAHLRAEPMAFEDMQTQLVDAARARHKERLKNVYLTELTNKEVNMTEEALELMVTRQFGDDYLEVPEGQ